MSVCVSVCYICVICAGFVLLVLQIFIYIYIPTEHSRMQTVFTLSVCRYLLLQSCAHMQFMTLVQHNESEYSLTSDLLFDNGSKRKNKSPPT